MKIRNTFIIFLVSGFWHGANWTFIVWGGLNALFMMPLIVSDSNRKNLEIVAQGKLFPTFRELISMLLTFSLTTLCWIVFRAEDMGHAWTFISGIFTPSLFTVPTILPVKILVLTAIFMVIEWLGREQQYAIANVGITMPRAVRWGFYYAVILAIFYFVGTDQQFIYFQF
jgi:D-alanyl-lipoteichoic acid acyltransferase DltB (MBOAT superfamily)